MPNAKFETSHKSDFFFFFLFNVLITKNLAFSTPDVSKQYVEMTENT